MSQHWICYAERECYHGGWMIGENEHGDLFVPRRDQGVSWRRFNQWNPLHWLAYWNSKRRNELAWLESNPDR
jgi:hypothetical protein